MEAISKLPDVTELLTYEPRFIDPALPSGLWFCENAEAVQVVGVNAVSLPLAGCWNDLSKCRAFFELFPYVVVVAADDTQRARMVEEIQRRVCYMPILVVPGANFKGCRTLTEFFGSFGYKAVEYLLTGAEELPAYGLLNLAEVEAPDLSGAKRTISHIPELDRAIGGFYAGELSVWTGKRGGGKSTLLGQLLLQAVDQGHRVCAYSGELPAHVFKRWIYLQAAGPNNIEEHTDKSTGKRFYTVPPHIRKRIDQWMDRQFFLYDLGISSAHDEDSILAVFEMARRCYGCDVFLADNLMTARLKAMRDSDYYRAQSNFTGRLVTFSKRFDAHVHLVAHPRKSKGLLEGDDISGSGEIVNRADNAFALSRLSETEVDRAGFQCGLTVLKNRAFGSQANIGLDFEPASRRFYKAGTGSPDWRFGWEYAGEQTALPDDGDRGDPFEDEKEH